jgi:hypothetical protein
MKLWEVFLLTAPAVLSVTLPFAALFGSTMAYGRLSEDRELVACRASGVSLLTLVKPAMVLAVLSGVACFFLSNYVISVCVHQAGRVAEDQFVAASIAQLRQRGRVQFRGITVTATYKEPKKEDLEGISGRVGILERISAVRRRRGEEGRDESVILWAREGVILFPEPGGGGPRPRQARVSLGRRGGPPGEAGDGRRNVVLVEPRADRLQLATFGQKDLAIPFPAPPAPNIKHMSIPELMDKSRRPFEHVRIAERVTRIRRLLAERETLDWLADKFFLDREAEQMGGPVRLELQAAARAGGRPAERYLLEAPSIEFPREDYLLRAVQVTRYSGTDPSKPHARYRASFGVLRVRAFDAEDAEWNRRRGYPRMAGRLSLELLKYEREVPDPDDPDGTDWRKARDTDILKLSDLLVPADPAPGAAGGGPMAIVNASSDQAIFEAACARYAAGRDADPPAGHTLASLMDEDGFREAGRLHHDQRLFRNKILAEVNTRLAFALSTIVFVLLGAAMGTIFRGGTPLKALLISFLPWAVAILLVIFGKRLAEGEVEMPVAGVTVIWVTVIGFVIGTSAVYAWLLRR